MSAVWRDDMLDERFAQLTDLLKAGELFWRHHAFQMPRLPWEELLPELSRQLRALPLAAAEQLACDDAALNKFLQSHLPLLSRLAETCAIGAFAESPLPDIEPRDIPGRKWQQIRYFAPRIPANAYALLEWCAGKSHLGRTLAALRGGAITALECDEELIEAGKMIAVREHIAIDFQCVDVMTVAATAALQQKQNAVALHACGDLHTRLLQCCAQRRTATITLAPCCYQLSADESRYTLSHAAAESELHLRRDDLRTAVHGTVTAPQRQTRQRRQLQAWRLGFDVLQRDVRGSDAYLPTPSLPLSALAQGFEAFCRQLAQMKCVDLPAVLDYAKYQRMGEQRLREVLACDLPRIAFRRALELWLVLDRALFLREHGYGVEVGVFCTPALTPRNILIRAVHDQ